MSEARYMCERILAACTSTINNLQVYKMCTSTCNDLAHVMCLVSFSGTRYTNVQEARSMYLKIHKAAPLVHIKVKISKNLQFYVFRKQN